MDLLTLLATAAGTAGEKEHSAAPFLFIGGALAAFAVLIGVLGIMRPNWGGGAMNLVMGVGVLLAAGSMVAIVAVS
jgi:hypothetical protein